MTLRDFLKKADLESIYIADEEKNVVGAYAGDLLSWVIGRAQENEAFLTIMTNVNVVAVAALAELSCIIFCENVPVPEEVIAAAKEKQITLLRSSHPTFQTAVNLSFLANQER